MKLLTALFMLVLAGQSFSADVKKNMNAKMDQAKTSMNPTQLDDLIRGEMAAVKSYDTVLSKVKDQAELGKIKAIREDHMQAVTKLKTFANADVKEDTKTAGAWGGFASAWAGGAKLMGDATALKALTQGEEHGIREYKEALEDDSIKPELKEMIRTQFLPKQQEHIQTIKSFM